MTIIQTPSKSEKIAAVKEAIQDLQMTSEGISFLLFEALETVSKILPKENELKQENDWEVK